MANFGKPDTNNSQFFITTVDCSHLDGTNVVFGRVIKGLSATTEMENCTTDEGVPSREITIIDCGEIKDGDPLGICDEDGTTDNLPSFPLDWERFDDKVTISEKLQVLNDIKESGNFFYRAGNILKSAEKYMKCARYYKHFKDITTDETEVKQLDDIQLVNLTNLAATELKIESYNDVLSTCNEAIKLHDKNFKAFYRRGIANVKVKNFEDAVEDLEVALKLQPGNHEIRKKLDHAKKVLKDYRNVEKEKYQKMFN
jgi:peptidyl-prolyl isomerase D